jgi:drug/metabolite transporter (DMT)-like permease
MAIFGKLAYRADVGVLALLNIRFVLAAALFWALAARQGLSLPSRRIVLTGLGLGLFGYAAQAGGFFAALTRMDASLTSLLLYAYPALVAIGALALRRERASARRWFALGIASAGVFLVLAGGGIGALDGLGVALAFGAAFAYATYILVADTIAGDVDALVLSALVCTGAAVTFTLANLVSGGPDMGFEPEGWLWIAGIVLVSTVAAITLFFEGLRRVGPSTASIASTVEPAVTVTLAFLVFGEHLAGLQLVGGALVLGAVVLLQARRRTRAEAATAPALA